MFAWRLGSFDDVGANKKWRVDLKDGTLIKIAFQEKSWAPTYSGNPILRWGCREFDNIWVWAVTIVAYLSRNTKWFWLAFGPDADI
jgi:hypothetical protein